MIETLGHLYLNISVQQHSTSQPPPRPIEETLTLPPTRNSKVRCRVRGVQHPP